MTAARRILLTRESARIPSLSGGACLWKRGCARRSSCSLTRMTMNLRSSAGNASRRYFGSLCSPPPAPASLFEDDSVEGDMAREARGEHRSCAKRLSRRVSV